MTQQQSITQCVDYGTKLPCYIYNRLRVFNLFSAQQHKPLLETLECFQNV